MRITKKLLLILLSVSLSLGVAPIVSATSLTVPGSAVRDDTDAVVSGTVSFPPD